MIILLRFRYVRFIIFFCQVIVRVAIFYSKSRIFETSVLHLFPPWTRSHSCLTAPHVQKNNVYQEYMYVFLTPNGNCSPTSSVSLSWSFIIKPLDPFPDRDRELMTAMEITLYFFFRMLSDNPLESIGSRAFTIPNKDLLM